MGKYSVEVREPLRGGDDYSENHFEFDTPEEVKKFLKEDMHEDEHLHSVLLYEDGKDYDPKDVTHQFMPRSKPSKSSFRFR